MIKELTYREESLIHESVLTRIHAVKKLLKSWEEFPPTAESKLVESYTRDLEELEELERNLLKP